MSNTATTNQNDKNAYSADRTVNSDARNTDRVTDKVDGAMKSVASTVRDQSEKLTSEAKEHANSATQMAKETYHDVEETIKKQSDHMVDFIKAKPFKSVLIASGAGLLIGYFYRK